MSKQYRICPYCGCTLDPGEHCDCRERAEREAAQEAAQLAADLTRTGKRKTVSIPDS